MKPRCLIVDPSAMVRRVATRIVKELGFDVMEAADGRIALDSCAGTPPDAVLLEWRVGDMDGTEVIAGLREMTDRSGTTMPTILFCTSERSVEQIVTALKAGADEYIMKPFDSDIVGSKFALAGLLAESEAVISGGESDACAVP